MAGGGQKGVGGIEFAGGAMILLGFIGGCTARGWVDGNSGDNNPMSAYDEACVQEYADANDGNRETKVETDILDQPDCQAVVVTMKAERRQEQIETVEASP